MPKLIFWQQLLKNSSYLPILHLTIYPFPNKTWKHEKMLFLGNFFQIQKTHFNILPTDVAVSEAEQKMKRSYCKLVESMMKLEWTQVKRLVLQCWGGSRSLMEALKHISNLYLSLFSVERCSTSTLICLRTSLAFLFPWYSIQAWPCWSLWTFSLRSGGLTVLIHVIPAPCSTKSLCK